MKKIAPKVTKGLLDKMTKDEILDLLAYVRSGATIVKTAAEAWGADMVVKVKEPLPAEFGYFREGLLLYPYLHLAAERELTLALAKAKVSGMLGG